MRVVALGLSCNSACVVCALGALRATARPVDPTAALAAIVPGDVVEIEVEGIGVLVNRVEAPGA